MSENKVRMIPATIIRGSAQHVLHEGKRPVCGYARVSTDSDEQETSYEAQVDYYTKFIQSRPDWEFKGIYTDAYTPAQAFQLRKEIPAHAPPLRSAARFALPAPRRTAWPSFAH